MKSVILKLHGLLYFRLFSSLITNQGELDGYLTSFYGISHHLFTPVPEPFPLQAEWQLSKDWTIERAKSPKKEPTNYRNYANATLGTYKNVIGALSHDSHPFLWLSLFVELSWGYIRDGMVTNDSSQVNNHHVVVSSSGIQLAVLRFKWNGDQGTTTMPGNSAGGSRGCGGGVKEWVSF